MDVHFFSFKFKKKLRSIIKEIKKKGSEQELNLKDELSTINSKTYITN